ncbi:MAG: hypothetical protein AAF591_19885 [Verrucomicrobiota bacterium]
MRLMRLVLVLLPVLGLMVSCARDGSKGGTGQGGGAVQGPYYNSGETVILTAGEAARVIPPGEAVR